MFSSMGTPDKVRECTEKGAGGFVMKPCKREELLSVLTRLVDTPAGGEKQ